MSTGDAVVTAVPAERLLQLNEQLLAVPEGFTINTKLARQLERRRETVVEGGIDWGQAEALAYGSLLEEGIPVRLSGQDAERGTFAHRHLMFHDPQTDERYAPIQHLPGASASFEVYNSPLSEYAALGFEYGYSVAAPDALVLWEAQFGDFVNGAQIVIDQFLVAGRSKWGQTSRLTLLLPHGYEGNGPEHSSARLERFMQQGAQDNIRIANCTTAAQFFHLLRRQALDATARPLIVMTPKGLLRLRQASSTLSELSGGRFPARCSTTRRSRRRPAVRPFTVSSSAAARSTTTSSATTSARTPPAPPSPGWSSSTRSRWRRSPTSLPPTRVCGRSSGRRRSRRTWERGARSGTASTTPPAPARPSPGVTYVGRPWRAAPSEGYPTAHQREQDRIVRAALGVEPVTS